MSDALCVPLNQLHDAMENEYAYLWPSDLNIIERTLWRERKLRSDGLVPIRELVDDTRSFRWKPGVALTALALCGGAADRVGRLIACDMASALLGRPLSFDDQFQDYLMKSIEVVRTETDRSAGFMRTVGVARAVNDYMKSFEAEFSLHAFVRVQALLTVFVCVIDVDIPTDWFGVREIALSGHSRPLSVFTELLNVYGCETATFRSAMRIAALALAHKRCGKRASAARRALEKTLDDELVEIISEQYSNPFVLTPMDRITHRVIARVLREQAK